MIKRYVHGIRTAFLCLALTITGSLASASTCEIQTSGPLKSVKFRSGRTVVVIGHGHGLTGEVMQLVRLADDTETPNDLFLLRAATLLMSLLKTHSEYRTEVKLLTEKIKAGEINFIALEYGDRIMELMSLGSKNFMPMARENFKKRGLSQDVLLDSAFLVFAGPAHYLAETEPELMKNIPIVAVEDDELMEKSLGLIKDAGNRLDLFAKDPATTAELATKVDRFFMQVTLEYDLRAFLDDDWIMNEIEREVPAPLLAKAKDPVISALAAAEILRQRDQKLFPKLMKQPGSGVLLIGSAHSRSISNKLKQACLE